jgi:predicted transcriptional regulator
LTARYNILSDVIASPTRIEIVNKLSDYPTGLSYEDIVKQMPDDIVQVNIRRHLNRLIKEDIVEDKDGKYSLSKLGEHIYSMLTKIAAKAKAENIFSGAY